MFSKLRARNRENLAVEFRTSINGLKLRSHVVKRSEIEQGIQINRIKTKSRFLIEKKTALFSKCASPITHRVVQRAIIKYQAIFFPNLDVSHANVLYFRTCAEKHDVVVLSFYTGNLIVYSYASQSRLKRYPSENRS